MIFTLSRIDVIRANGRTKGRLVLYEVEQEFVHCVLLHALLRGGCQSSRKVISVLDIAVPVASYRIFPNWKGAMPS